jgi:DNA-binding transcriptional LysR family regulator
MFDPVKLAPYPLLLLDSSFGVRNTFDAACRLAGFKPNIFIESRSPQALLALAHGVAIMTSVLSADSGGLEGQRALVASLKSFRPTRRGDGRVKRRPLRGGE